MEYSKLIEYVREGRSRKSLCESEVVVVKMRNFRM